MSQVPTQVQLQAAIDKYEELTGDRLPDGDGFDYELVSQMFQSMLTAPPS